MYLEHRTGIPVYNIGHVSMGLDQICLAVMTKSDHYTPSVIIVEQYPWAIHRILNTTLSALSGLIFILMQAGE